MWRRVKVPSALFAALLLGAACTGVVGERGNGGPPGAGGSAGGSGGGSNGPGPTGPVLSGADTGAGTVALTRVTLQQLNNMYRDLLGDTTAPANANVITADSLSESTFYVGATIADLDASGLLDISQTLANNAVQDLTKLMPGQPVPTDTAGQATWAQQFIQYFGRRAYRRPLVPGEAADLLALYQTQLAPPIGAAFPDAIAAVITGMLLSPAFLYRWELGPQPPTVQMLSTGPVIRFGQYEIASRLSFWLWSTMPDDTLLNAAGMGQLSTSDQIQSQITRMLADPKASDAFGEFATEWVELKNLITAAPDPSVYPEFANGGTALLESMGNETRQFTASVLGPQGDGLLSTLLTSSKTFIDANLASLYGVAAPAGQGLVPVTLDPTQRAGIFTQAAFLTVRSNPNEPNPILRGSSMLRRVFCSPIQMPANAVLPPIPDTSPQYPTIRARYDAHGKLGCAGACHAQIDPPGFAFMHYDGVGKWTDTDTGHPVDATGSITIAPQSSPTYTTGQGGTIMFTDAIDLMKQLAERPEVSDCMTDLLLRYMNRRIECPSSESTQACLGTGDTASLTAVRAKSTKNVRDMMTAFAATNAFLARMPNPGEVIQ
jgi:hypothetical protein